MSYQGGNFLLQLFIRVIKGAYITSSDWSIRDLPRENSSCLSNEISRACPRLDSLPCVFVCIALFSADIIRTKVKRAHERFKCGTRQQISQLIQWHACQPRASFRFACDLYTNSSKTSCRTFDRESCPKSWLQPIWKRLHFWQRD